MDTQINCNLLGIGSDQIPTILTDLASDRYFVKTPKQIVISSTSGGVQGTCTVGYVIIGPKCQILIRENLCMILGCIYTI